MEKKSLESGCVNVSIVLDESRNSETIDSYSSKSKFVKNKSPRGSPSSGVNALNKCTSQIKKPPHRKTSPLNWFPRKKGDSYLKRKIKLLQEAGGMNDTLDETLGHSNPHYCRVEREKIAVREAACKVMEARKAAMVEASWCRILQAARIPTKEADVLLLKAEKEETEAFDAATAKGVIWYDTPDHALKHFEIVTSSARRGKASATTHTVKASFETAFEVDKQVAAAVKKAFIRLAHCSPFHKDEFKDLLRKISENPETQDLSESDNGSELEMEQQDNHGSSSAKRRQKKLTPESFNSAKLVDIMFERLKCLKEEELSSLATIVATSGLNAALADTESCHKAHNKISTSRMDYLLNGAIRQKQVEPELPSLDKFLVKKMTKLEKEVQEAQNSLRAESNSNVDRKPASADDVADLSSVLVKHSSKFEKEIEEAKRNQKLLDANGFELERKQRDGNRHSKKDNSEVPSLDKFLVKHVSRLEREVHEAKNRKKEEQTGKENLDSNRNMNENGEQNSLDKILVKPLHRLEREKLQAQGEESGNWNYVKPQQKVDVGDGESLDKVLVKHVSRLEKERMGHGSKEMVEVKKKNTKLDVGTNVGGLDQILIKHKSRLEREKSGGVASEQPEDGKTYSMNRREARERELLELWGGIGLGNSMQPRVSRLEQEKVAWLKAEEDEKRGAKLEP